MLMEKKWIINSKEYFPYSSRDIYLNWWITSRKPNTTQAIVEFLYDPVFYSQKLLKAEKQFLELGKKIDKQIPRDITKYFENSIKDSNIFKTSILKGKRIYAIKVPFHIKKWKTRNGKTIWEDVAFSDGTSSKMQIIDKNYLNIILSSLCSRHRKEGKIIDTRFIGSDEIIFSNDRDNVYGIKINEMKSVLKSFRLDENSDCSLFLFLSNEGSIREVIGSFIDQFNSIVSHGFAGLVSGEQRPFDSIAGNSINEKIENIIKELSICSHPYFPESVFASACRNGLGSAILEVIGINSGWKKVHPLKKFFAKWMFSSLFWTSSNWIKLFFQYSETPNIYHKLFGENSFSYRGGDIDWSLGYIKSFSNNKKVAVIDLGIGTGRELEALKENPNIKKIIGIDYSDSMISFCREKWKDYPIALNLIRDDFSLLKRSKKLINEIDLPKIFTIFFGTINNTTEEDRIKMLISVRKLMKKDDIFIIEFSKRPEKQDVDFNHPWLKFKNKAEEIGFYEANTYAQLKWFWDATKENFRTTPQFFYEKRTHNIMITVTGVGSCFFSHRYSLREINKLVDMAKMRIKEIREGKEMYTVVIKK